MDDRVHVCVHCEGMARVRLTLKEYFDLGPVKMAQWVKSTM